MARAETGAVETYVALLRGINVGGKNVLPMKELARLFADAGAADVRTYIQSGNVVFRAGAKVVATLASRVGDAIRREFGFDSPVILRSADELRLALERNPFANEDSERLHFMFMRDEPAPERVAKLDPHRSPPDRFAVRGREVYLHLPGGAGKSKPTNAYFDATLATIGTIRNMRTVIALIAMCGQG
ncbi:MAG: DUF1697 domain-containing protein [Deltaproteobacteria bacterium]|nr:DUF1697 domain-containing protein [Deltaproteobacteria bacterium]